jgi:hypothetical protein
MPNTPPAWVPLARNAVNPSKKALIVEGDDDFRVLQEWLRKEPIPSWTNKIFLTQANSRGAVLKGLKHLDDEDDAEKASIFGLVDRDEWEAADVAELRTERPTLLVNLERHSIESYFCDPSELIPILESWQKTGEYDFAGVIAALPALCEASLVNRVPHWALCCVVERRAKMISLDAEYPHYFKGRCPLPTDNEIRAKLQEWAALFDADAIFDEYTALRDASRARPLNEQYRSCVEPKEFLTQVVMLGENGLNSVKQENAGQWMTELARYSEAMPLDLRTLLQPLFA